MEKGFLYKLHLNKNGLLKYEVMVEYQYSILICNLNEITYVLQVKITLQESLAVNIKGEMFFEVWHNYM